MSFVPCAESEDLAKAIEKAASSSAYERALRLHKPSQASPIMSIYLQMTVLGVK